MGRIIMSDDESDHVLCTHVSVFVFDASLKSSCWIYNMIMYCALLSFQEGVAGSKSCCLVIETLFVFQAIISPMSQCHNVISPMSLAANVISYGPIKKVSTTLGRGY